MTHPEELRKSMNNINKLNTIFKDILPDLNKYITDLKSIMYKNKLINNNDFDDDSDGIKSKKTNCFLRHIYQHIILFMLMCLIPLQSFTFYYVYKISSAAKNLELYTFNKTETTEYIDKFEKILTYICDNENIC